MPPVLSGRDLSNFCWIDPVGGASFFPKPVFGSGEEAPDVGAVPQYRQNCRCGKKGQGKRASGGGRADTGQAERRSYDRQGYGGNNTGQGYISPGQECRRPDDESTEQGERCQGQCRSRCRGHPFAAFESEIDGKNMAGDGGRTASQGEPWHFWIADLHDDRWNRSLQEIKTEANPSRTFTHTPGNVGGPDVSGSGLANVDPMQFADQKTEGNCSHQI